MLDPSHCHHTHQYIWNTAPESVSSKRLFSPEKHQLWETTVFSDLALHDFIPFPAELQTASAHTGDTVGGMTPEAPHPPQNDRYPRLILISKNKQISKPKLNLNEARQWISQRECKGANYGRNPSTLWFVECFSSGNVTRLIFFLDPHLLYSQSSMWKKPLKWSLFTEGTGFVLGGAQQCRGVCYKPRSVG